MNVARFIERSKYAPSLPENGILLTCFFLAGLLLQFNGYVGGIRYSDISCAIFASACCFFALQRGVWLTYTVVASIAISILLCVSIINFYGMESNDRAWIMRCLLAILFGAIFYFSTERQRKGFVIGLVVGGVMGFLVAVLQFSNLNSTLIDFGLRTTAAAARGLGTLDQSGSVLRSTGMWGDANEFGPVGSLVVVASLYLFGRIARSKTVLALSVSSVVVNSLFLSFNRSSLAATVLTLWFYSIRNRQDKLRLKIYTALAAAVFIVAIIWLISPESFEMIRARYAFDAAGGNIEGRIASTVAAFRLIFEYPFGLSSEVWPQYLRTLSWVEDPHNGFVSTAFGGGLAFGIFSFLSIIYCIFSKDQFCQILSSHLFTLFMFETLNFSPGIVYLLGILWAKLVLDGLVGVLHKNTATNQ